MPKGAADNASWVNPGDEREHQRATAMHGQRNVDNERRQEFHVHATEPPERRHPRLKRYGDQNSSDGDERIHSCPMITITSSRRRKSTAGVMSTS